MAARNEKVGLDLVIRSDHDPRRPALNSRQAANRLDVTPQAVIDSIKRGALDGYCMAGPERKRWFAYADSVEATRARRDPPDNNTQELRDRLTKMENAFAEQRAVTELQSEGQALFEQAAEQMAEANKTLVDAYKKLRQAQEVAASFTQSDWVPAYPPGGG